eukprot:6458343-Pyramimonas_sp.AAC.1
MPAQVLRVQRCESLGQLPIFKATARGGNGEIHMLNTPRPPSSKLLRMVKRESARGAEARATLSRLPALHP